MEDTGQKAEGMGQEGGDSSTAREAKRENQAKADETLSVFDRARLLARVMDDEDLVKEVLQVFLENTPLRILELQAALDGGDASTVRLQAHTIKGMAANVSCEILRLLAKDMEWKAENASLEEVQSLMAELNTAFEQVEALLQSEQT